MIFQPERISKTATIQVNAPIAIAFVLFGPLKEKDWALGWEPEIIYGNGDVEQYMIFKTDGPHINEKYTWAVTQYDPNEHRIDYAVSAANRIWFINVQCTPVEDKTMATISYTYTGLSENGNEMNRSALKNMFAQDLKDWEEAINHFLATGKRLEIH